MTFQVNQNNQMNDKKSPFSIKTELYNRVYIPLISHIYLCILLLGVILKRCGSYIKTKFSHLNNSETIYFDFETTGLNPFHEKVIDYAFIQESTGQFVESLVNPNTKFEKIITDITGIHPDELEDKQPMEAHSSVIEQFLKDIQKNVPFTQIFLVAHNSDGFDKFFLERIFKLNKQASHKLTNYNYIDSLLLAKKLYPTIRSYSLANLATKFDIKAGTHRALSDTKCLQQVYHSLLEELSSQTKLTKEYYLENPEHVYNYIYQ